MNIYIYLMTIESRVSYLDNLIKYELSWIDEEQFLDEDDEKHLESLNNSQIKLANLKREIAIREIQNEPMDDIWIFLKKIEYDITLEGGTE